jgi:hypothetical protein
MGRYHPPRSADLASKTLDFIGVKQPLKRDLPPSFPHCRRRGSDFGQRLPLALHPWPLGVVARAGKTRQ